MDEINKRIHPRHFLEKPPTEINFKNIYCAFCAFRVLDLSHSYCCQLCRFIFHEECATTLVLSSLTINHAKIHEHTLNFIPRRNNLICDACGEFDPCGDLELEMHRMNMYGCLPCDFFIHKECIYLPRAIKITRHSHRLFHTFYLRDYGMCCGVCQNYLKVGYGGYTCIKTTCDYFSHSHCATRSGVWDGKDVEGEPEEEESDEPEVDLTASLVETGLGTMHHFSHDHDLTRVVLGEEKSGKLCQACILRIDFGNFLFCQKCEYALHDACANLPRNMEHAVHRHPLTLHAETNMTKEGFFICSTCNRGSCGFMYKCSKHECGFRIDITCASIVEPLHHPAYLYPLFLTHQSNDKWPFECSVCEDESMTCMTDPYPRNAYNIILDFKCATVPRQARYNYDTHPLNLEMVSHGVYWCEICEEKPNGYSNVFIYTCHKCFTIVHADCLLGRHPYMKPGHKIQVNGLEIQIASNNGVSRQKCRTCQCICQDKVVFINRRRTDICFCSMKCIKQLDDVVLNVMHGGCI